MSAAPSAGYSGTPLARKLGVREGCRLWTGNAPAAYRDWLAPLPPGVQFVAQLDAAVDLAHLFTAGRAELDAALRHARQVLAPTAVLWISWPKKSSKLPSEVTEETIRELALPLGFVDVKVCAVDEVWSGLKLVVRRELR
ncbi:MAG: DUF3052 family protein [Holophagales bacterium]|nr:MAG: DUF3052 family protein [Holophagales bacterium]